MPSWLTTSRRWGCIKRAESSDLRLQTLWCPRWAQQVAFHRASSAAETASIYNHRGDANREPSTLFMKKNEIKNQVTAAIKACLEKKAEELNILEMQKAPCAFTDYFVLCSG